MYHANTLYLVSFQVTGGERYGSDSWTVTHDFRVVVDLARERAVQAVSKTEYYKEFKDDTVYSYTDHRELAEHEYA